MTSPRNAGPDNNRWRMAERATDVDAIVEEFERGFPGPKRLRAILRKHLSRGAEGEQEIPNKGDRLDPILAIDTALGNLLAIADRMRDIHGLCPGHPIANDPAATCSVCNMSRRTLDVGREVYDEVTNGLDAVAMLISFEEERGTK